LIDLFRKRAINAPRLIKTANQISNTNLDRSFKEETPSRLKSESSQSPRINSSSGHKITFAPYSLSEVHPLSHNMEASNKLFEQ
jgi:hypothetical protein